jgi:transposase
LEGVGETLRQTRNVLAEVAPDWLQAYVERDQPEWAERSRRRIEAYRLPTGASARQAYAEVIGADGWDLLDALEAAAAPVWVRELPVAQRLRRVWTQQYPPREVGGHWRQAAEAPPAGPVQNSPSDPEARDGKKRETTGGGTRRS